ncbi:MAG: hypothetical protein V4574_15660 [Pseudomonadota bacterium]
MALVAFSGLTFVIAVVCLLGAITRPGVRLPLALTAVLSGLACYGLGHVFFAGGVLVMESSTRVKSAALVSGGGTVEMRRLGLGFFYGEPAGDSSLRVSYADGSAGTCGYFTGGSPEFVSADPPLRC